MASLEETAAVMNATTQHRGRTPTSSIVERNALMNELKGSGGIKKKSPSGGGWIEEPVILVESNSSKNFYGLEPYRREESEPLKTGKQYWVEKMQSVVLSGREMAMNMGDSALFDYLETLVGVSETTVANRFNVEMHQDGSAYQAIAGIRQIITNAPNVGNYLGIDRSIYTKWRHRMMSIGEMRGTPAAGKAAVTIAGVEFEDAIDQLHIKCTDGVDKPTFSMMSTDLYTLLEKQLRSTRQTLYTDTKSQDMGFTNMVYKGIKHTWDENVAFGSTVETMMMLTPKYITLFEHSDVDWKWEKPRKMDGRNGVEQVALWMGNMFCTKLRNQGAIVDSFVP